MNGRLPKDKNTLVVFYCGGEQCPLSTTAAEKAIEMGYKQVGVYKGGWRGWVQTASR
jgi:rhodanese-related sulfurtransferase